MMNWPKAPNRTAPGVASSNLDRALRANLGRRKFGKDEMIEIINFFGVDECVYCGSSTIKRWDHLVSIREGGETVIGNIVPACAPCDDSKRNIDFRHWITSNAKRSPKSRGILDIDARVKKIEEYVEHYNYVHKNLDQRLSMEELIKYQSIMTEMKDLREEAKKLIADFRERTGNT